MIEVLDGRGRLSGERYLRSLPERYWGAIEVVLDRPLRPPLPGRQANHQGSPQLRWALYESAQAACRPTSPDRAYYLELKQRVGANRGVLSVARKLLRRAHHTLRELGDDALAPAA